MNDTYRATFMFLTHKKKKVTETHIERGLWLISRDQNKFNRHKLLRIHGQRIGNHLQRPVIMVGSNAQEDTTHISCKICVSCLALRPIHTNDDKYS